MFVTDDGIGCERAELPGSFTICCHSDVLGLFWRHEGTDVRKVSIFSRNFDCLQGIRCRGIFVRQTQYATGGGQT